MLRVSGVALVLFALGMAGPMRSPAAPHCRLPCLAHKVTDLKFLTLELRARLEEAEAKIAKQTAYATWLKERDDYLEARNTQSAARLANFQACFGEVPISRYGEEQGPSGYVFQLQGNDGPLALPTTALDVTYDPDPVGAWIWVNTCNRERVSSASRLRSNTARFIEAWDK